MPEENPRPNENIASFVFPNIEAERGEIERVAGEFAKENSQTFARRLIEQAKVSELVAMDEDMWSRLENTDSFDIRIADWETVEQHAVAGHAESPRDWQALKKKIESGSDLDAPIVCALGDRLHLVSGNTRLMVARALGMQPRILLINLSHQA